MHSASHASFFYGACLFFPNRHALYTFLAVSAYARSFYNAISSPQHEFSRTVKATKFIQTRFAYQIRNNDVCVDARNQTTFRVIDTADVYALTRFVIRADRKCSVARNIGAIYILQSCTLTAEESASSSASRRYVSYLKQTKRKSFKRKASTHIHTHTYTFQVEYRFPPREFPHKFPERDRKVVRAQGV